MCFTSCRTCYMQNDLANYRLYVRCLSYLPATKVVDGSVCDFVLGDRTSKLHLPATKVVDGTVCDFVLGERT